MSGASALNAKAPMKSSMVISGFLHLSLLAAALLWQGRPAPERPPVYKVNIVGAPPGERSIGIVDPRPAEAAPTPAPVASGIERPPEQKVAPMETVQAPRPAPIATPTPSRTSKAGDETAPAKPAEQATSAPRAGSTAGGQGADVATVRVDGIDFPSPGYLNNIVRQVELRFSPDRRFDTRSLRAEVSFLIHRDGQVSDIRVERSSGEYRFDLDARSAVESAGSARAFGPLPAEWTDDVLRVYFDFIPKGMR